MRNFLPRSPLPFQLHEALSSLLEAPPLGCAVLLSDWKELETLPLCWQATGDQFFAQARHELSVFGALLVEHADESTTAEKPVLVQSWMVVVSTVLDHTSLRTAQLISLALDRKKSSRPWTRLCFLSDCGPHYRSMETICHALVTLHQKFDYIDTEVHFGCEKHFKSAADRLFGWCRQILLRCRDRKIDILDVNPFVCAGPSERLPRKQGALSLAYLKFLVHFHTSFSVSFQAFPTPSNPFLPIQALWSRWTIQVLLTFKSGATSLQSPVAARCCMSRTSRSPEHTACVPRNLNCEVSREFGTTFFLTSQEDQKSLMKWCLRRFRLHGAMDFGTKALLLGPVGPCLWNLQKKLAWADATWVKRNTCRILLKGNASCCPISMKLNASMPNLWHERVKCALRES